MHTGVVCLFKGDSLQVEGVGGGVQIRQSEFLCPQAPVVQPGSSVSWGNIHCRNRELLCSHFHNHIWRIWIKKYRKPTALITETLFWLIWGDARRAKLDVCPSRFQEVPELFLLVKVLFHEITFYFSNTPRLKFSEIFFFDRGMIQYLISENPVLCNCVLGHTVASKSSNYRGIVGEKCQWFWRLAQESLALLPCDFQWDSISSICWWLQKREKNICTLHILGLHNSKATRTQMESSCDCRL